MAIELFKTNLIQKRPLAPDVLFLRFSIQDGKLLDFKAGQYLSLMLGEQRRLFSIASMPSQKETFDLVVKLLPDGLASNYFRKLETEDQKTSYFQGPMGLFTIRSLEKPKFFLAAGTGIAPIRSQIFSLLEQQNPAPLMLFWGLKRKGDIYFFDELKYLKNNWPNFDFKICLDLEEDFSGLDVDHIFRGRADKAFSEYLKEKHIAKKQLNDYEYYLCAGREIVEAMKNFLQDLGVAKENIFFDKF